MLDFVKRLFKRKALPITLTVTRTPEARANEHQLQVEARKAIVNARRRRALGFDRSTKRRPRNAPRASSW